MASTPRSTVFERTSAASGPVIVACLPLLVSCRNSEFERLSGGALEDAGCAKEACADEEQPSLLPFPMPDASRRPAARHESSLFFRTPLGRAPAGDAMCRRSGDFTVAPLDFGKAHVRATSRKKNHRTISRCSPSPSISETSHPSTVVPTLAAPMQKNTGMLFLGCPGSHAIRHVRFYQLRPSVPHRPRAGSSFLSHTSGGSRSAASTKRSDAELASLTSTGTCSSTLVSLLPNGSRNDLPTLARPR